jgi:hypothetical protein
MLAIPALVRRRVVQAEIGAEIENAAPPAQQLRDEERRFPVW